MGHIPFECIIAWSKLMTHGLMIPDSMSVFRRTRILFFTGSPRRDLPDTVPWIIPRLCNSCQVLTTSHLVRIPQSGLSRQACTRTSIYRAYSPLWEKISYPHSLPKQDILHAIDRRFEDRRTTPSISGHVSPEGLEVAGRWYIRARGTQQHHRCCC